MHTPTAEDKKIVVNPLMRSLLPFLLLTLSTYATQCVALVQLKPVEDEEVKSRPNPAFAHDRPERAYVYSEWKVLQSSCGAHQSLEAIRKRSKFTLVSKLLADGWPRTHRW